MLNNNIDSLELNQMTINDQFLKALIAGTGNSKIQNIKYIYLSCNSIEESTGVYLGLLLEKFSGINSLVLNQNKLGSSAKFLFVQLNKMSKIEKYIFIIFINKVLNKLKI